MFTYEITPAGPNRFRVSVRVQCPLGTHLIGDFCSQAAAEAFVSRIREVDAGDTHILTIPPLLPYRSWTVESMT